MKYILYYTGPYSENQFSNKYI